MRLTATALFALVTPKLKKYAAMLVRVAISPPPRRPWLACLLACLLLAFEGTDKRVQCRGDVGHVAGGTPFGQAAAEGGHDEQGDLALALLSPVRWAPRLQRAKVGLGGAPG